MTEEILGIVFAIYAVSAVVVGIVHTVYMDQLLSGITEARAEANKKPWTKKELLNCYTIGTVLMSLTPGINTLAALKIIFSGRIK